MSDLSGSIATVGVYSLFLCSVFAYRNRWRVGLKFHFVATTLVAVTVAAWGGLVIGAIYMLRAIRSIWHGESGRSLEDLLVPEANAWRRLPFVLLLAGLLFFGIFPGVLANRIKISAEAIVKMAGGPVEPKAAMAAAQPDGRNP